MQTVPEWILHACENSLPEPLLVVMIWVVRWNENAFFSKQKIPDIAILPCRLAKPVYLLFPNAFSRFLKTNWHQVHNTSRVIMMCFFILHDLALLFWVCHWPSIVASWPNKHHGHHVSYTCGCWVHKGFWQGDRKFRRQLVLIHVFSESAGRVRISA